MKIGVGSGGHKPVVLMMLPDEQGIIVVSKKPGRKPAHKPIYLSAGVHRSVHRIVGGDKQARI